MGHADKTPARPQPQGACRQSYVCSTLPCPPMAEEPGISRIVEQ
jgi:hypothetical protein